MANELPQLLRVMMADMEVAPSLYQATRFWKLACSEILNDVEHHGIDRFRALPSALKYFVPTYAYPGYHTSPQRYEGLRKALTDMLSNPGRLTQRLGDLLAGRIHALADYRVYLASKADTSPRTSDLSESTVGDPIEQFEFDDCQFSRSFLNYLLGLNFFKDVVKSQDLDTVLEIGGGYGTLGEILLKGGTDDIRYINVDIPPVAFFSTYYLQQVFGRGAVGDYLTLRGERPLQVSDLRKRFRATVLCPWQLPDMRGSIDLFVNYISFQEMEPEVVRNYVDQIIRLQPKYVLLRNIREGKQIAQKRDDVGVMVPIRGTDYDKFFEGFELLETNTLPFGHRTEDGFHSELRLYRRSEC